MVEYGLKYDVVCFSGGLVDIDTIFSLTKFFALLGTEISIDMQASFFDIDIDFIQNIVVNPYFLLEKQNKIVFIGINLRIELPLFNSKLRKLNNARLYSIGLNASFMNFNIKNYGFSINNVLNVIKGKNKLNIELIAANYVYTSFIKYIKNGNVSFIFGNSFSMLGNSSTVFKFLKKFVNTVLLYSQCFYLFNNVGIINYLFLNNVSNSVSKFLMPKFYFFEAVDDYLFLKKFASSVCNNFIVYHGSFFDEGAKQADMILPCSTYFESNLRFFNYFGAIRRTNKVISIADDILSGKEFFNFLDNFSKHVVGFRYFMNFSKVVLYFDFLLINFNFINVSMSNKLNYCFLSCLYIENKIFSSNILNFYKNDVYSRNSKNLHLASLEYLKLLSTYLK